MGKKKKRSLAINLRDGATPEDAVIQLLEKAAERKAVTGVAKWGSIESALERCVTYAVDNLGTKHPATGRARLQCANLYLEQQKHGKARKHVESALAMVKGQGGGLKRGGKPVGAAENHDFCALALEARAEMAFQQDVRFKGNRERHDEGKPVLLLGLFVYFIIIIVWWERRIFY